MKVVEIQNAFGIENVKIAERPAASPGPGQVLVRMRALSLNYRDLLVVRGMYLPNMAFPLQLVSDGCGEIAALGDGVTRVKVGDRVCGTFMQSWIEGAITDSKWRSGLGGHIPGMAAEYVVLDAAGVVPVPDHLTDEEAATLPCAAVTAWNALVTEGKLKAGETVLVQGTGGVSIFALQFAKMMGARVIATSSSDAKLDRVKTLGASDGINYKSTPEWGKRVVELTEGRGVDHVVEVGGAGTLAQSMIATRLGGRISLIGVLTGGEVNPIPILMKSITVQGIFVGSAAMFEDMNRAIAQAGMRPIVDRIFPFDEFPDALRYMESGAHFGKIVVKF